MPLKGNISVRTMQVADIQEKKKEVYQVCKQEAYTSLTLSVRKVYTFCKPPLDFGSKGTGGVIRASPAGRRQGHPYFGALSPEYTVCRLHPGT